MFKLNITALLTVALLLNGCTYQRGWTPTVDSYNKPNAYRLNQDLAECEKLALQVSSSTNEKQIKSNDPFQSTYRSCLRQRKQTVIN